MAGSPNAEGGHYKEDGKRTLVDVHTCTHAFESKRDMVDAMRKTSRIARNHHHSSH